MLFLWIYKLVSLVRFHIVGGIELVRRLDDTFKLIRFFKLPIRDEARNFIFVHVQSNELCLVS